MGKLRKYIVQYYGWINSYGDWDCDDFIVKAPNIKEAKVLMNERMKGKLIKGQPHIQLLSTYNRKMKEWTDGHEARIKELKKYI
tara:strand:- start:666 stop:917 length:252 start_codon:yes stop_codon:yes gene_type:complete